MSEDSLYALIYAGMGLFYGILAVLLLRHKEDSWKEISEQ